MTSPNIVDTPMANENENRANLESNIRIASRILSGSQLDPLGWRGDSPDRNLPLFCYLSQLLSLGERGIAATGILAFDSSSGKVKPRAVVASTSSNKSRNVDQQDTKSEWEFKYLVANGNLKASDIKDHSRYPRQPVDIETHIQDFLAVCKLARAKEVDVLDINTWIVGRCWTSIHRRVQKAERKGTDGLDLIERLRNWRPAKYELIQSKEFDVYWVPTLTGFLYEHDLKPTSAGKYIMDASTALKWIGLIANILDRLRHIFNDELQDPTPIHNGNEQREREFLNKGRVEAVESLSRVLGLTFSHREVQNLFGLDSLRKVTLIGTLRETSSFWYEWPLFWDGQNFLVEYSDGEPTQGADAAYLDHAQGTESEDIEYFEDDLPVFGAEYTPIGLRNGCNGSDSLFLYLRALTMWRRAVLQLFGTFDRVDILSSLEVCCVDVTACAGYTEGSSLVDSAMQLFTRLSDETWKAVKMWIEEQVTEVRCKTAPPQVHAEAGLLALIYDAYRDQSDRHYTAENYVCTLKPFNSPLPIGTTTQFCGMCNQLADLLKIYSTPGPHVELQTLITYGTIYPWDPPAHLPIKILVELHKVLISKLARLACRKVVPI